jgi:5-methyltetrahydrofolate--homocysteine methyltransferase
MRKNHATGHDKRGGRKGASFAEGPGMGCPEGTENLEMLQRLSQAVLTRDFRSTQQCTERLLERGMDFFLILNQGLIPGMLEANDKFRKGEFYVPELLMSSRALKLGLDLLRPLLRQKRQAVLGKVVIGTVRFDLHDIGKNLVVIVLEANGFEVVDLGVDVSPERFVKAVRENDADALAMSCLLTSTLSWMNATIKLLRASKIRKAVKTIIGGAPITPILAKNVGADGYGRDATAAPDILRGLLLKRT